MPARRKQLSPLKNAQFLIGCGVPVVSAYNLVKLSSRGIPFTPATVNLAGIGKYIVHKWARSAKGWPNELNSQSKTAMTLGFKKKNTIIIIITMEPLYCGHHWDIPKCPD